MVNTKIEGRIQWVDALKGFLILLVVMGHMADPKDASSGIYSFIYTFHMPLFFMVSGILALDIRNKNVSKYIGRKTETLLIPFLSFAIITSFLKGWQYFPLYFLADNKHGLWFLLVLFVFCSFLLLCCKVVKYCTRKKEYHINVINQEKNIIIKEVIAFVILELLFVIVYYFSSPILRDILIPKTLFLYWPYFIFGYVLSNMKIRVPDYVIGVFGIVFFAIWWSSIKYGLNQELLYQLSRFCACFFFLYCFMNISDSWLTKALGFLGEESLSIYVMHYWFYPGVGAFLLSHCGGIMLFNCLSFLAVAVFVSLFCIVIKRVSCTNRLLSFILWGKSYNN